MGDFINFSFPIIELMNVILDLSIVFVGQSFVPIFIALNLIKETF